jgi:hypothetical protein
MGTTQVTFAGMRWVLPEVTCPEEVLTRNHVPGSCPDRKWRNNWKYVLRMPGSAFPHFFLTRVVVVKNLSLRMTNRATGSHVTPKRGFPCVRMRNRTLRNIRPSGAFDRKWRYETSPLVTEGHPKGGGSCAISILVGPFERK